MKRNEVFSIFRFLFAVGIVAFHFAPRDFATTHRWFCSGATFVTFFFVLSGFMLTISSFNSMTFDSLNFISKRVSRLMPQYYMALLLILPFAMMGSTPLALFLDVFFLQSWVPPYPLKLNGPGWFISCLVSFIVFFPAIFRYVRKNEIKPHKFLIGALALWAVSQLILITLRYQPFFYRGAPSIGHDLICYFPPSNVSSFVLGIALGYAVLSAPQLRPRKLTSLVFFVTAVGITFAELQFNLSGIILFNLQKPTAFYAPMFGVLILSIAWLHEDFLRPFDNRLIRYLGDISFSVYLFQLPVLLLLSRLMNIIDVSKMRDFIFYLFILICVASIFQSFIQDKANTFFFARIYTMLTKLRRMAAADG